MPFHVGIDIGGTFTDTIAIDPSNGSMRISKVPSTPHNQAEGFMQGLRAAQVPFDAISWLVHGTTVGTNATLERNGAVCGLITTQGFRDLIELGRRDRPQLYGLHGEFVPLIARDHRLEVPERLNARGEVVQPLDEDALRAVLRTLLQRGVEALVIGFLHAYANPVHERRAREIALEIWPNPYVTCSVDILREYREVERLGTAAVNAYIQPRIHRYVSRIQDELRAQGVKRNLAIMQTNGGIMSAEAACVRAVNTVMSGPAAGVIAAAHVARQAGFSQVITCDLGGTSFDVGLIIDGEPIVSAERDLAFNLPMRIPVIDIHTIGAGGGSIAHVNEAGMLQVGPRSAGAQPGPIAYGRGGTLPTVTDANVLLGRLSARSLLAVDGAVDVARVEAGFEREVGRALKMDALGAAAATLRIVNDAMAGAIRMVSLQRGHDPREFALFAFGGAGPLHTAALARELGVPHVIVPYLPGITCALGCIVADARHDFVQTVNRPLAALTPAALHDILEAHRREGEARLQAEQVPVTRIEVRHEADMQYEGQSYAQTVEIDPETLDLDALGQLLKQAYLDRFGIDLSSFPPRLISIRSSVIGQRTAPDLRKVFASHPKVAEARDAITGHRQVWFGGDWVRTPTYDRAALPAGARIDGPAIFDQMDTTTVAEPGNRITVDEFGNLIIEVDPA
ncbi:MAG: hydantoinase/oxoprolinase family protein [Rubrivivax sp.]